MSKQKILPIAVAMASVVIIDGAQSALYVNEQLQAVCILATYS